MSIPVVDLAKFTQGSDEERKQFVADLGKAYEDVGFGDVNLCHDIFKI